MSPGVACAWTLGCHALFWLVASLAARLRGGDADIVTLGAAQGLVYGAVTYVLVHVHERGASLRSSLGLRPTHAALGLAGVGLGLSLKVPAEAITSLIERFFPLSEAQLLARAELYRTERLGDLLGLLLVVCLVAPWFEEVFFRGALFGRLARRSLRLACFVSGLLFVVVHGDPRQWPALGMVAFVSSYLRMASGSLLPCLALHVTFNAVGLWLLVMGAASPTRPLQLSIVWTLLSWLAAGLLLGWVLKLADNPEAARARREDQA